MSTDKNDLHLIMHENAKRARGANALLRRAAGLLWRNEELYGMKWGDPDILPPLRHIRDEFLLPYISPEKTVVEIGPGGGRWTRYLLGAKKLYAVDAYSELLDELRRNYDQDNMVFYPEQWCRFSQDRRQQYRFHFYIRRVCASGAGGYPPISGKHEADYKA